MPSSEKPLIAAVKTYLATCDSVAWAHRMNAGAYQVRGRWVRFGFPGCPDFMGMLKGGRFFCIECKGDRDRLRPAQRAFLGVVESGGGMHIVARSLADVRERIK